MGHGDVAKLLPSGAAVQIRCFVKAVRDGNEARQQQDHGVARIFPEIEQDDHKEGCFGVHPVPQRKVHSQQHPVEKACFRKDQLHDLHNAHDGHDVGQQQDGFQGLVPLHLAPQHQGDGVGNNQHQRQGDGQKLHGIAEGLLKQGVAGHIQKVLQAHKPVGIAHAPGQGVPDHHCKGNGVKDQASQHQRRGQEDPVPGVFLSSIHVFSSFFLSPPEDGPPVLRWRLWQGLQNPHPVGCIRFGNQNL